MFKWLLILFVIFLGILLFKKEVLPQNITASSSVRSMENVLFGLDYLVGSHISSNKISGRNIVDISSDRLLSLFSSVDSSGRPAVIYLYDTHCFFCRYVLKDVNELAKQYTSQGVLFLVIAFESDRERLSYMLSELGPVYFRPLIISPEQIKTAAYSLSKYNVGISDVPVTVFKEKSSNNYVNMTTDYATRKQVVDFINAKD